MKVFAAKLVRNRFAANAAKLVLALVAMLNLGCRSRSERDLVERELRMHEDQVYMLEDYLAEYQEIVRRCRCENRELQQELDRLRSGQPNNRSNSTLPDSPQGDPSDDSWSPDRPRSRSLLDRGRSPALPDPFKDDQPGKIPNEESAVPEIKIEVDETEIEAEPAPPAFQQETRLPRVHEPSAPEVVPAAILGDALPLPDESPTSTGVRGEFLTLPGREIPSLHVSVEPHSTSGEPCNFRGSLEVMLLDPAASSTAPSLARWEFTPEEVENAWRDPELRETLDVLAGLPAELSLDRPLELWIRLLPDSGGKVLASTVLIPIEAEVAGESVAGFKTVTDPTVGNVVPAGHWVPSKESAPLKSAGRSNSGWLPHQK